MIFVNMWEFDPPYSCALLTWVEMFWMLVPLCSHRSQMWYWEIILGCRFHYIGCCGRKAWDLSSFLVMGSYSQDMDDFFWFFFIYCVLIQIFNNSSYSASYLMCYSCASARWVSSLVLSIGLMWLYGYSNRTALTSEINVIYCRHD